MSQYIEWQALGQVLIAGLVVGAGLPALFALGLRLLNPAVKTPGAQDHDAPTVAGTSRGVAWRTVGSMACFSIVALGVLAGIAFIVIGGH